MFLSAGYCVGRHWKLCLPRNITFRSATCGRAAHDISRTKSLIALLISFDVLFTWSYFYYRNPVYHQIVFASIVLSTTLRVTYLLRWSELALHVPDKTKSTIGKLFSSGAALFAFGFLIWNLDNIFCDTLTVWKTRIGWPRAFLLEGHSWWHVLTGAGTYYMFVGIQYITLCAKDDHRNYTVEHWLWLPHLFRVNRRQN